MVSWNLIKDISIQCFLNYNGPCLLKGIGIETSQYSAVIQSGNLLKMFQECQNLAQRDFEDLLQVFYLFTFALILC